MKDGVQDKICGICGGTGQLSYFKGVSRFLLSHDECPECAGTGYNLNSVKSQTGNSDIFPINNKEQKDKS